MIWGYLFLNIFFLCVVTMQSINYKTRNIPRYYEEVTGIKSKVISVSFTSVPLTLPPFPLV